MTDKGKLVKKYPELKEDYSLLEKVYNDLQEALCKTKKEIDKATLDNSEDKNTIKKILKRKKQTECYLVETKKNMDRMAEILQEIEKELDIS